MLNLGFGQFKTEKQPKFPAGMKPFCMELHKNIFITISILFCRTFEFYLGITLNTKYRTTSTLTYQSTKFKSIKMLLVL